jgi:hypothetical protein
MKPQPPQPPQPRVSIPLSDLVATHLIGAVEFGTITIRYQNGRPTHVERNEMFRLTEEGERPTPR